MKRILCVILCAVMLCSILPPVTTAADEAGETVTLSLSSNESGEISVRLAAPASMLIAAAYRDGQMIACETKEDCAIGEYEFSLPACYRYKVFALDGDLAPLGEAAEITDDSAVFLGEESDVVLPTLDDSVAAVLGAAVSDYAKVSLALQQIQDLFADEEAFEAIQNDPALYMQYSRMLSDTENALQDTTVSFAALDAVTQNQIDQINTSVRTASVKLASPDSREDVIHWAEDLSKQFDALEGNNRIQQMAKNMGCDVKTAYSALTAAQEVLYNRYTADANCYENWEKAMIAIKATSKVALFVCATAATAGAATVAAVPAALTTGTVSVGSAACMMVGAADVGLELGTDAAKIIIGGNAKGDKVIQAAEDKLKPVTDGLLLFSLCTLNTASGGERLAFLGDLGQRAKELYDNVTIKDDNGVLKADIVRLAADDPSAAAEVAKKSGLLTDGDVSEDGAEPTVALLEDEYGKNKEELAELLKAEGIIETDRDFNKLIKDFNGKVVEEVNANSEPDPDDPIPTHPDPDDPDPIPYRFERIVESYDADTGMLTGITCYDAKGNMIWRRAYVNGKVSNFSTNEWDENGDRIETWTRYFLDPATDTYTTQIDWIMKTRYINGSYTNTKTIEEIDYNDNGTIGERTYYDAQGNRHDLTYNGDGILSMDTTMYPDRTYQLSYYTTNDPNVPGVDRIGHLQYEYEYHEQSYYPVYTIRKEWVAQKRANYTDRCYEYGWNCSVWNGSYVEGSFVLVYSEPMPDE